MQKGQTSKNERIELLLSKYLKLELTEEETLELKGYSEQSSAVLSILERFDNKDLVKKDLELRTNTETEKNRQLTWAKIQERKITRLKKQRRIKWMNRMVAAAAIIVIAILGIPYVLKIPQRPIEYTKIEALLTGTLEATLPDGSHVRLNNGSTLRYPTVFTGASREVEMTGEVYFEVAKNLRQPFRVIILKNEKKSIVEVLGTIFNVSAYENETMIRTTLKTGQVKVTDGVHAEVLFPNDQLTDGENSWQRTHLTDVDLNKAIAWKEGIFQFVHDSLPDVLRKLSRSYGQELVMSEDAPQQICDGTYSRNRPLSSILESLSHNNTSFHFTIEGNKLLILK